MSEETRSTPQPTDAARLKRLVWFKIQDPTTGAERLDRELWTAISETSALISQRPHSTVYYPGAFMDIPFPLAITNADTYVFVDPSYEAPYGKDKIVKTLKKVGHDVTVSRNGERQEQIAFTFNGRPRTIHLYAEDAALFVPEELRKQPADILFLKNTYGGPTELQTPDAFHTLLSGVEPNGSIVTFGWGIPAQSSATMNLQELSSKPVSGGWRIITQLQVFSR